MTSPAPVPSSSAGARKRAAVGAALAGLATAVALLVARSPHPSPMPAPIPNGSYWTCSATDSLLVDASRIPAVGYLRATGARVPVRAVPLDSATAPEVAAEAMAIPCVVSAPGHHVNDTTAVLPVTTVAALHDSTGTRLVVLLPRAGP